MIDCLVLLGPPGSGKSHLGELLARRLDLDWTEHESLLLERWGTKAAFVASKSEALAWLEEQLLTRIRKGGRTVVFESTGLSDRPMLERLARAHRVVVVKLVVPRELCEERVAQRAHGRHLEDDPTATGRFHDHWTARVAPSWQADLEAVNDAASGDPAGELRTEAIVRAVAALLSRG